jgi:ribonuclease HI
VTGLITLVPSNMTPTEALEKIEVYLANMLADPAFDPHVSTLNHLDKIMDFVKQGLAEHDFDEIVDNYEDTVDRLTESATEDIPRTYISCDSSITKNPGGNASWGLVVRHPDPKSVPFCASGACPKSITNNQAEYDAVYQALLHVSQFPPKHPVEIRTDSKLIVDQLNGTMEVNDSELKRRNSIVLELLSELEGRYNTTIDIVWYPRNSTDDMRKANYLAQDFLGVHRH